MRSTKSHYVKWYCMLFLPFLFLALSSSLHAQTYVLTVANDGNGTGYITGYGIDCGLNCYDAYTEGQSVILNAAADSGSAFGRWSGGGCSGTGMCEVTMNADVTVTAIFNVLGPVYLNEGTIGTHVTINGTGFGTKKGKVTVGGKSCKVSQWTNESITCQIKAALPPGTYDVVMQSKEPKGAATITYEEAFTMMAPEIVLVDPGSAPTREIDVTGIYFGTKKGAVYLVNQESGKKMICRVTERFVGDPDWDWEKAYTPKENVYLKKCKVKEWNMNQATGESMLTFVVHRMLRAGTYGVEVVNKVGKANALFTVN